MANRSGMGGTRFGRSRPWRALAALAAGLVVAATLVLEMSPASAGTGVGVVPNFTTPVTVGQTGLAASVNFFNSSTAPEDTGSITLSNMTLIPACDNFVAACAGGTPDPGLFQLSASATGAAGTACAGNTFNVALINPGLGQVEFQPLGGPVVLGPPSPTRSDECQIDFTFGVNRASLIGPQVHQLAGADAVHNTAGTRGSGFGTSTVTVNQATPTIATRAAQATVGQPINDTAQVTGTANLAPTGTVTFTLFDSTDPNCAGGGVFNSTNALAGGPPTATATSGTFTPAAAGNYKWVAVYNGDANYLKATSPCGAANETSVISRVGPTITTQASPSVVVGGNVSDDATLAGATAPTGTITFNLFGPNDANCSGAPAFTSVVAVAGNGTYPSGNFTTTAAGTYRWIAAYSGDGNNAPVSGACNDANESVTVRPAFFPTVTTQASGSVPAGGNITDTATLAGGNNPTGTMTFTLFGPDNSTCAGPATFTSVRPVNGNGPYTSDPFTTTAGGTYRWVAKYSGDATNAAASTGCNDPNESVVVTKVTPTLRTTAGPDAQLGDSITDTAALAGGTNPTGTITFNAFGPDNNTCAGAPAFTSTVPVNGNGNYVSGPFTPTQAGVYRWVATYNGDGTNNATAPGACNDRNERVTIRKNRPSLSTQASPSVDTGGTITDTATLSNGLSPGGHMVFALFAPGDTDCTGQEVFGSSKPVSGNGNYTSDGFVPTQPGTYRWIAIYSGDQNNAAVLSLCNAPNEAVVVTGQAIATTTTTVTPGRPTTTTTPPNPTTTLAPGVTTTTAAATTTTVAGTTTTTRPSVGSRMLTVTGAAISLLARLALVLIALGAIVLAATKLQRRRS